nr:ankyrin repeat protein [Pandoravirus massiliensis]
MDTASTRTRRAPKSPWVSSSLSDAVLARILVDHLADHHRRVAALVCARWRRVVLAAAVANGGSALDLRLDGRTQGLLARDGCLAVLVWVAERVPRGDAHWYPIVRGAASGGRLAILDWAATEVPRAYLDGALPFVAAAAAGHIGVLKGLYARGFDDLSGPATCTAAVDGGHLACAEWLLARGAPLDYQAACERAVAAGDLNVLAWLCVLAQDETNGNGDYDWDPVALMALAPDASVSKWLLDRARADAVHARQRRLQNRQARRRLVDSNNDSTLHV